MAPYRKKKKTKTHNELDSEFRLRMPRSDEGEILALVEERLPSNRLRAMCQDGEVRLIRIPGKMRRRVWVRVGDVIIIKPWELENEKADLVWRYFKTQSEVLQKKGLLKGLY